MYTSLFCQPVNAISFSFRSSLTSLAVTNATSSELIQCQHNTIIFLHVYSRFYSHSFSQIVSAIPSPLKQSLKDLASSVLAFSRLSFSIHMQSNECIAYSSEWSGRYNVWVDAMCRIYARLQCKLPLLQCCLRPLVACDAAIEPEQNAADGIVLGLYTRDECRC